MIDSLYAVQTNKKGVDRLKDANLIPLYSPGYIFNRTEMKLEAELMIAAIRLDIFSCLTEPVTVETLAARTGYHCRNLELLLNALTAAGFLVKEKDCFCNLPETEYYLNRKSELYLGENILYWHKITNLQNIEELVRKGPTHKSFRDENGSDSYDFRMMAQVAVNAMYTGRVQAFIAAMKPLFPQDRSLKILDIGGGSGIFSVELARYFAKAKITVFDQPSVTELTGEIIGEYGVEDRVETKDGNFITDDLGGGYDLLIASGILDFVGDLNVMAMRLYAAMKAGGYLYVSTHNVNETYTGPARYILGWLSSHMDGLDILKTDAAIRAALLKTGLTECISAPEHEFNGYVFQKIEHENPA